MKNMDKSPSVKSGAEVAKMGESKGAKLPDSADAYGKGYKDASKAPMSNEAFKESGMSTGVKRKSNG